MREYACTLAERQRSSHNYRERCKRDPEYRLRVLNGARVWQGLKSRATVDEIGTAADGARNRQRDDLGRFV